MNYQPQRTKFVEKRCDNCEEIFLIPLVREGYAHRLICRFSVCPLCNPNAKKCRDCFVPFNVKPHYAKGMCRVCYGFVLQHEKGAK